MVPATLEQAALEQTTLAQTTLAKGDQQLEKLNDPQKDAVRHDKGPLIVLAGPGTGKTRVIVHRIAHAIEVRGVQPEHVLAATFTVKAANQLRERLAGLIGPSRAEAVRAHTLHGLAYALVREHTEFTGLPRRPDLLDPAQEMRLIAQTLREDDLFAWTRAEGLGPQCDVLRGAFDTMSNMGVTPQRAMEFAEGWQARLESDPPAEAIERDAERARLEDFAETARAFSRFTERCRSQGWLTFADIILLAIEMLRKHESVRSVVRSKTRCVVVDEFQDCNAAQIELLRLIAGPDGRSTPPDICVVGDDDQAIYAFRHADERAFPRFEHFWPKPTVINLSINYRSATSIVAAANHTISRATTRYRPDKAIQPDSKEAGTVRVIQLERDHAGADAIATIILSDRERARKAPGGVVPPLRSFAVICPGWNEVDQVEAALSLRGIPCERSKQGGARDDQGVGDVLAWIEWILDPGALHAARRLLSRPPHAVPAQQIVDWDRGFHADQTRAHLDNVAAGATVPGTTPSPTAPSVPATFDAWLAIHASDAANPHHAAAQRLVAMYTTLRAQTREMRGDEAVYAIISKTDVAHTEIMGGRERARRVRAVAWLVQLASEKQRRLDQPGGLREFWEHFQALEAARGLSVESSVDLLDADRGEIDATLAPDAASGEAAADAEPTTPTAPSAPATDPEGRVRLMTAHASKGLEFPTVIVARAHGPSGFPRSRRREGWAPPPGLDPLSPARSEEEASAAHTDEQRRLFYVACTRAERRLIITSRIPKTPTKTTNFTVELLNWSHSQPPPHRIATRTESEFQADAVSGEIEEAGAKLLARAQRTEAANRLRRGARLEAAQALEHLDRASLTPEQFTAALARLRRSAESIAAISAVEAGAPLPDFTGAQGTRMAELLSRLEQGGDGLAASAFLFRPMPAPLRLSYSTISAFTRCPRCFYVTNVLGVRPPESDEIRIGNIAHAALEAFYRAWRSADADGQPLPGRADLRRFGRAEFRAALSDQSRAGEDDLAQLDAQLDKTFDELHSKPKGNKPHILEIEQVITFPYEHGGHRHTFTAKIDRIDEIGSGGKRIIDYKSGRDWKSLTEPKADDLQMGIYAMALEAHFPDWDGTGEAQYWLLATGSRGVLDLSTLKREKIREVINEAITSMLEGRFEKGDKCNGDCEFLGLD